MTLVKNIIFQKLPTKYKHKTQNKRIISDPVEYHRIFCYKKIKKLSILCASTKSQVVTLTHLHEITSRNTKGRGWFPTKL